ncbi:MAG: DUF5318 family protein [Acidimicrobiia bacterium]
MTGEVDHRLARRALIKQVRAGEVSRTSVCDAHPELLRVARRFGRRTRVTCPICAEDHLVTVSYVFGPRLPSHGRFVETRAELEAFDARPEHFTAYLVEVCRACSWHHLLTQRPLGGRRRSAIARSSVH